MRGRALIAAALWFAVSTHAAEPIRGWIETERSGVNLRFTGFVQSDAAGEIRFELSVTKQGRSGRSESRQAGRLRLEAGVPRRLSQSSVSIADGDEYCAQLALYQADTLVARQALTDRGESDSCSD